MKTTIVMGMVLAVSLGTALASEASGPAAQPAVSVKSYWRYQQVYHHVQLVDGSGNLAFYCARRYAAQNNPWNGASLIRSADAPAGWEKPDFDDSGWCVQRMPFCTAPSLELFALGTGSDGNGRFYVCHIVRRFAGRARFMVPDPARVTRLRLRVEYAGGLIASVNGQEAGRGHIPAGGPLAVGGYAEVYPDAAYAKDGQEARKRVLEVEVPRSALVAGVNVLTLDCRLSPQSTKRVDPQPIWVHMGIETVSLAAEPEGAVLEDAGPGEPQVWAEDVLRWVHTLDYLENGVTPSRTMAICAARNGVFSGQAVLRAAGADLNGPSASVSDLVSAGGQKIPATAVLVRWGRGASLSEFVAAGSGGFNRQGPKMALSRYSKSLEKLYSKNSSANKSEFPEHNNPTLQVFDRLTASPPAVIAQNTAQPVWLTVRVLKDTAPGDYLGALTIRAGGLPDTRVEVRLNVQPFALPETRAFASYVGVDESPWVLAKGMSVAPWSEAHWKLLDESLARAGELGARVAGIPVIHGTELNNDKDSLITFTNQADRSYSYDFSRADRYLDLWKKHGHAQSDVILYIVGTADHQGRGGGTGTVNLSSGGAFTPPKPNTPEGLAFWTAFAKAAFAHFKARGFPEGQIHWGFFTDFCSEDTQLLADALAMECPGVGWATSRHDPRIPFPTKSPAKVSWQACVRGYGSPFKIPKAGKGVDGQQLWDISKYEVVLHKAWKDPKNPMVLSRADTGITALGGMYSPLWQLRQVQETAIAAPNCKGLARFGVDGWGRQGYFGPYIPSLLYPGAQGGLDGSVQFEVLREGLQECEARIALADRPMLPPEVKRLLDERTEINYTLPCYPWARIAEYHTGWQERSRRLYEAASTPEGK